MAAPSLPLNNLADPGRLPTNRVELGTGRPLRLDSGAELGPFTMAYQTYGTLNGDKSNAIMVCHALTGDQFVADPHPLTGKPGWWEIVVGPGKVLDTNRFFIICANVVGGCMGTAGPNQTDPATDKPYGLSFPVITISDMVRGQVMLLDHLGIDQLFCIIGGSMGGMQVLEMSSKFPDRVFAAIPLASGARHSAQNIAFHEVGRQAIMADPDWCQGDYLNQNKRPTRGLAVARMEAHITYLSDDDMAEKFGRDLRTGEYQFGYGVDFEIESYLRYQGDKFSTYFDANTYLLITKALDYFDPARECNGTLEDALADTRCNFLVMSFNSDWRFSPERSREIVNALVQVGRNVSYAEIDTPKGHDAFLLPIPEYRKLFGAYMGRVAEATSNA